MMALDWGSVTVFILLGAFAYWTEFRRNGGPK